jgi:16S rRNA (guanine1516-N2)-methyltransferase
MTDQAQALAASARVSCIDAWPNPDHMPLVVVLEKGRVGLARTENEGREQLVIDFCNGALRWRVEHNAGGGLAVARACGVRPGRAVRVVDLTAGLGRDAWVLASRGAQVLMIERAWPLAFMLEQAIKALVGDTASGVMPALSVHCEDALDWLARQKEVDADVLYLDPMFPGRKKSAAVKKDMAILHTLLGDTRQEDNDTLMHAAMAARGVGKVVVKRPAKAPWIAGIKPASSLSGKTLRFDIYPRPL